MASDDRCQRVLRTYSAPACPFECDFPVAAFENLIRDCETVNGGHRVTAQCEGFELQVWLLGHGEESIDGQIINYFSQRAKGKQIHEIDTSWTPRGSRLFEPYLLPVDLDGASIAGILANERTLPSGGQLCGWDAMARFDSNTVLFCFTGAGTIDAQKTTWLRIMRSFRLKNDRPPALKPSSEEQVDWLITTAEKQSIDLIKVDQPIDELVTKFGGQPVWFHAPQWPISKSTGKPMEFIGQISLKDAPFQSRIGKMAYLFMSQGVEDCGFTPDGGECAVVVQPGIVNVMTIPQATGPTIQSLEIQPSGKLRKYHAEYAVHLTKQDETYTLSAGPDEFSEAFEEIKIGGCPTLIVDTVDWKPPVACYLLLQLPPSSTGLSLKVYDEEPFVFLSVTGDRGWILVC